MDPEKLRKIVALTADEGFLGDLPVHSRVEKTRLAGHIWRGVDTAKRGPQNAG